MLKDLAMVLNHRDETFCMPLMGCVSLNSPERHEVTLNATFWAAMLCLIFIWSSSTLPASFLLTGSISATMIMICWRMSSTCDAGVTAYAYYHVAFAWAPTRSLNMHHKSYMSPAAECGDLIWGQEYARCKPVKSWIMYWPSAASTGLQMRQRPPSLLSQRCYGDEGGIPKSSSYG